MTATVHAARDLLDDALRHPKNVTAFLDAIRESVRARVAAA